MTQQPEALRLADALELADALDVVWAGGIAPEAASELRRLHALNAEMLAALKACNEAMSYMSEYDIPLTLPKQVKAAIEKATK